MAIGSAKALGLHLMRSLSYTFYVYNFGIGQRFILEGYYLWGEPVDPQTESLV